MRSDVRGLYESIAPALLLLARKRCGKRLRDINRERIADGAPAMSASEYRQGVEDMAQDSMLEHWERFASACSRCDVETAARWLEGSRLRYRRQTARALAGIGYGRSLQPVHIPDWVRRHLGADSQHARLLQMMAEGIGENSQVVALYGSDSGSAWSKFFSLKIQLLERLLLLCSIAHSLDTSDGWAAPNAEREVYRELAEAVCDCEPRYDDSPTPEQRADTAWDIAQWYRRQQRSMAY